MSSVRFLCPFCPPSSHGDVEAVCEGTEENAGESYVTHSVPPCGRFLQIDEENPESFADFLRDCRMKMTETAPS